MFLKFVDFDFVPVSAPEAQPLPCPIHLPTAATVCSLLGGLRQYAKRPPFLEYKNEWLEQYSLDERIIALEKAKEQDDKVTAELEARVKELEAKLA